MLWKAKTEEEIDIEIENGADINAQDSLFGQTFLHILVQRNSTLLDHFLSKGPNPNIKNSEGKTPIYYAKNATVMEKLVKNGASILVSDLDNKRVNQTNNTVFSEFLSNRISRMRTF